jgi:hypothetical protein
MGEWAELKHSLYQTAILVLEAKEEFCCLALSSQL